MDAGAKRTVFSVQPGYPILKNQAQEGGRPGDTN